MTRMPARTAAGLKIVALVAGAGVALTLSGVRIAARPRSNQARPASAAHASLTASPRTLAERYCAAYPDTLVLLTTDDLRTVRFGASRAAFVEALCT